MKAWLLDVYTNKMINQGGYHLEHNSKKKAFRDGSKKTSLKSAVNIFVSKRSGAV